MSNNNPNPLSSKCVLVNLRISVWGGKKKDRNAGSATAREMEAESDAYDAILNLVPKRAMAKVVSSASALRIHIYNMTLPWLDGGTRVLSSAAYFKFLEKYNKLKSEFDNAVSDFDPIYQHAREQGPVRLGKAFKASDFPSDIRHKFGASLTFLPFPKADDFRVSGLESAESDIRKGISDLENQVSETARQECLDRIIAAVTKVTEKLQNYSGKREGSFRDTLIENLSDLADVIPLLNVSNDQRIADLCGDLKKLSRHDPQFARESEIYRNEIINEANGVLNRMSSFTNNANLNANPGSNPTVAATAVDMETVSANLGAF